jgi:hypothetical protein
MDGLLDSWEQGRITSDRVVIREAARALVQLGGTPVLPCAGAGPDPERGREPGALEREASLDGVFIPETSATGPDPREIVFAFKQLIWVERGLAPSKASRGCGRCTTSRSGEEGPHLPVRDWLPARRPPASVAGPSRHWLQCPCGTGGHGAHAHGYLPPTGCAGAAPSLHPAHSRGRGLGARKLARLVLSLAA